MEKHGFLSDEDGGGDVAESDTGSWIGNWLDVSISSILSFCTSGTRCEFGCDRSLARDLRSCAFSSSRRRICVFVGLTNKQLEYFFNLEYHLFLPDFFCALGIGTGLALAFAILTFWLCVVTAQLHPISHAVFSGI